MITTKITLQDKDRGVLREISTKSSTLFTASSKITSPFYLKEIVKALKVMKENNVIINFKTDKICSLTPR